MTKNDIKTGMLVKTFDGYLRVIIGDTLVSFEGGGGISLSWFNEDLSLKEDQYEDFNIIKVYSEPKKEAGLASDLRYWLEGEYFIRYSELLFDREAITQEMTITEIEETLGKRIKIIMEK